MALVFALLAGGAVGLAQSNRSSVAEDEKQIRDLINRWEKAFAAKNLDDVMALYAPGDRVLAFDIVPPLMCRGYDRYRKNYEEFFANYEGPIVVEVRDLKISAGGDVAFLTCLERLVGTMKGGQKSDIWVRVTSGLNRIGGRWLIVHDHVSVPIDFETGRALLDLKPDGRP
jgi:uncharacterized protein (TIGR02246 family)